MKRNSFDKMYNDNNKNNNVVVCSFNKIVDACIRRYGFV